MDARERYQEVHAEYIKEMYDLFITDATLYDKINDCTIKLAVAAFEFGQESPKSTD